MQSTQGERGTTRLDSLGDSYVDHLESESKQNPHDVVWKIKVLLSSSLRANRQSGSTSDGLKRRLNKPRRGHGGICASAPPNVVDCASRRLSSPAAPTHNHLPSRNHSKTPSLTSRTPPCNAVRNTRVSGAVAPHATRFSCHVRSPSSCGSVACWRSTLRCCWRAPRAAGSPLYCEPWTGLVSTSVETG